ncbi:endonuclease/exonuclease/phosphatase family protein [Natronosporangium hydrolyticum]|uniref:Endonuclease/exonuclease/phosphatase family protein n=1 Tax=Natronosporangium hydrolyticum TaxID=2811111 RepID=A0A895Y6T3_9ACTN|nr:endonuclease/exonuclease/phosphatase family protein [Natronosporangium hydrolyticum]QSB13081.1 endonuclease/exonuclease/phosphatase family protein [Natronosporangium hydrolyticum]
MRVLTWNLWWRHGPWRRRQPAIAAALAQLAPDICGLQEVWGRAPAGPGEPSDSAVVTDQPPDDNLAAALAQQLGMHWCWAGRPRVAGRADDAGYWFGNAILSRWPITDPAQTPLPVPAGQQQRLVLHGAIAAPAGRLPFFTTHFSHPAGASAQRVAQARTVAGFVATHSRPDDPYPPVVTGDLNAEPDSDELRLLGGVHTAPAAPGVVLLDTWRFAATDAAGATWSHRNPYLADDPYPDARIDYLLVGVARAGRGRVRSVQRVGDTPVALPGDPEVWASDHFGVSADLAD